MSMPHDPYDEDRPKQTGSSPPAPDDELPEPSGRAYITARQRGVDATTLGRLVLHLPHVLASLAVVFLVSYVVHLLTGLPWSIPFGCWAASGALVFHRPSERLMARWLFKLRYPTPKEDQKLQDAWRRVTARAGVDGRAYQLWVEDSDAVNAEAFAGHIVGVTSHSLETLPPGQLAGVLAHELGHHTKGHAWASLLTSWYAWPVRLAWRLLLRMTSRIDGLSASATAVLVGVIVVVVVALATATYGLVLLPMAAPYLVAAVSRRSELRADEHAAALGYAPQLMAALQSEHREAKYAEKSERAAATARGVGFRQEAVVARLLDSHPDLHTRLHHLQTHLERRR
ncbi:M48 family metalloprotease [Streptomyces tauricus]|uniref:M48 family metalloprotease n=1 Tax=Streptomyces tauricus TaxID=68274 RepID=UPI00387EF6BF